jgi:hypothetical protein
MGRRKHFFVAFVAAAALLGSCSGSSPKGDEVASSGTAGSPAAGSGGAPPSAGAINNAESNRAGAGALVPTSRPSVGLLVHRILAFRIKQAYSQSEYLTDIRFANNLSRDPRLERTASHQREPSRGAAAPTTQGRGSFTTSASLQAWHHPSAPVRARERTCTPFGGKADRRSGVARARARAARDAT